MASDPNAVMVLTRFYDATPMRVRFGRLQTELQPHARYPFWSEVLGKWLSVRLESYMIMTGRKKSMQRFGVVELFAQGATIHQTDEQGVLKGLQVLCPPSVLEQTNSSCIFSATEKASPTLSYQRLIDLSKQFSFLLFNEVPDACSANIRKKAATAEKCAVCGNILHADDKCGAHQCHRIVEKKERLTIGHIFAMTFSSALISIQNRHQLQMQVGQF